VLCSQELGVNCHYSLTTEDKLDETSDDEGIFFSVLLKAFASLLQSMIHLIVGRERESSILLTSLDFEPFVRPFMVPRQRPNEP
jgi:hypothetical protein